MSWKQRRLTFARGRLDHAGLTGVLQFQQLTVEL
jgi:hypothetical protein